jgi:DNA-binding NtrC family response regulator
LIAAGRWPILFAMSTSAEPFSILVVDDDPGILALVRAITHSPQFRVRYASSAEEGLALLATEVPRLVISDYRLPGLDGISFLERVHDRHPGLKRILFTGEAVMRTSVGLDLPVIGKPCPPEELRELLVLLANQPG